MMGEAKFDATKFDVTTTPQKIIDAINNMAACKQFFWAPADPEKSKTTLDEFTKDVNNFIAYLEHHRNPIKDEPNVREHTKHLKNCLLDVVRLANLMFVIRSDASKHQFRGMFASYIKYVKDNIIKKENEKKKKPMPTSMLMSISPELLKNYAGSFTKYEKRFNKAMRDAQTLETELAKIDLSATKPIEIGAIDKAKNEPTLSEKIYQVRYQAFMMIFMHMKEKLSKSGSPVFSELMKALKDSGLAEETRGSTEETGDLTEEKRGSTEEASGLTEAQNTQSEISWKEKLKKLTTGIAVTLNEAKGLGNEAKGLGAVLFSIKISKLPHPIKPPNGIDYILQGVDKHYVALMQFSSFNDPEENTACSGELRKALRKQGFKGFELLPEAQPNIATKAEDGKREASKSSVASQSSAVSKSVSQAQTSTTASVVVDTHDSSPNALQNAIRAYLTNTNTDSRSPSPAPSSRSTSPGKGTDKGNKNEDAKAEEHYQEIIGVINSNIRDKLKSVNADIKNDKSVRGDQEIDVLLNKFYETYQLPEPGNRDKKNKPLHKLPGKVKLEKLINGIIADINEGTVKKPKYEFGKGFQHIGWGLGWALYSLSIPTRHKNQDGSITEIARDAIQYIIEKVSKECGEILHDAIVDKAKIKLTTPEQTIATVRTQSTSSHSAHASSSSSSRPKSRSASPARPASASRSAGHHQLSPAKLLAALPSSPVNTASSHSSVLRPATGSGWSSPAQPSSLSPSSPLNTAASPLPIQPESSPSSSVSAGAAPSTDSTLPASRSRSNTPT